MISTKYASIITVAAFVSGSFVASPELRAYAANTVFSTDIKDGEVKTPDLANNAVTSAKIKDGEIKTDDIAPSSIGSLKIKDNDVKAQDIAPDAVGGSELIGVSKILFDQCDTSELNGFGQGPGSTAGVVCEIPGADTDDSVMATYNFDAFCYGVDQAFVKSSGIVWVYVKNDCTISQTWRAGSTIAVIVYDK